MIGIDTFSWYKLLRLQNEGWKPLISDVVKKSDFFITHEVKIELEHRFPEDNDLFEWVTTLPKLEFDKQDYKKKGFDAADASLLEYNRIKGFTIITEDFSMIDEGISGQMKIIQLADFFGLLVRSNFIDKSEFYHLIKKLRKMRNITKRKEKWLMDLRTSK